MGIGKREHPTKKIFKAFGMTINEIADRIHRNNCYTCSVLSGSFPTTDEMNYRLHNLVGEIREEIREESLAKNRKKKF